MSSVDDKIRDRIRKLIELSKRGVGGEKENADAFLQTMLNKYGLTIDDFSDDVKIRYKIWYKGPAENKIMFGTIRKVLGIGTVHYRHAYRAKNAISVEMTKIQFAEFDYLYTIYREEYKKQSAALVDSFISVNELTGDDPDENLIEDIPSRRRKKKVTDAEIDHWRRVFEMQLGMSKVKVKKHNALLTKQGFDGDEKHYDE